MNKVVCLFFTVGFLFSSFGFADSFEIKKDGKNYLCKQVENDNSSENLSQLCLLARTGKGESIYYSNGQVLTYYAGHEGSNWYYKNGQLLTHYAGRKGSTWYYSNGQLITHYAGRAGATWYHPNGSLMTSNGPELKGSDLFPCEFIVNQ